MLRRALRRARPAARLSRTIYNLLQGGRDRPLSTVVYSDRLLRYGLPLPVRVGRRRLWDELGRGAVTERRAAGPRAAHVLSLPPVPRLAPRAGPLLGIASPNGCMKYCPRRQFRFRSSRKRIFILPADCHFLESILWEGESVHRSLDYRQPAGGVEPCRPRPVALKRLSRMSSACGSALEEPDEEGIRPQFAMPDDERAAGGAGGEEEGSEGEAAELTYEALVKPSPRVSVINLSERQNNKAAWRPLERKVLNTAREGAGAGGRGARLQRATLRALLSFSGLFYTVAFLTFYFLSLP